jgi:hypothetical protein
MDHVTVNQEVTISSVYFKNKDELETYPKQMIYDGHTYTFANSGWRYLVYKGQEIVRIFSVTDGKTNFRLKLEPSKHRWTLIDIKSSS